MSWIVREEIGSIATPLQIWFVLKTYITKLLCGDKMNSDAPWKNIPSQTITDNGNTIIKAIPKTYKSPYSKPRIIERPGVGIVNKRAIQWLKPGHVYVEAEPEFIGKLPDDVVEAIGRDEEGESHLFGGEVIRTEITVYPADDPDQPKIGFPITFEIGKAVLISRDQINSDREIGIGDPIIVPRHDVIGEEHVVSVRKVECE